MKISRFFRSGCILFFSLVSIISGIAGMPVVGFAQVELRLIIDPDPENHLIPLDSSIKDIWIEPRVSENNGTFEWHLDGPGEFTALEGGIGGIYRLPEQIDGERAEVMITVQFTNQHQETVQEHLTFQLLAPASTPTPVPTVTPAPSPTPVPTVTPAPTPVPISLRIRHTLLEQDIFFLTPGQDAIILLDIAHTPGRQIHITCKAIKGTIDCAETGEDEMSSLRTLRYIAPGSPGKDMVEVEILDPHSEDTDRKLIKIEVRE